jgi:hypothetical protein
MIIVSVARILVDAVRGANSGALGTRCEVRSPSHDEELQGEQARDNARDDRPCRETRVRVRVPHSHL